MYGAVGGFGQGEDRGEGGGRGEAHAFDLVITVNVSLIAATSRSDDFLSGAGPHTPKRDICPRIQ